MLGALLTLHNETANIWSHLGALGWVVHRSWETTLDETTSADARLYTQVRARVRVRVRVRVRARVHL